MPSKLLETTLSAAILLGFLGCLLFGERYVFSGPPFVAVLGYGWTETPGLIISPILFFGGAILHGYLISREESPDPLIPRS